MYATMDGVVRVPSAFSMILTLLPSMTATQLLVVPRSIPIILPMIYNLDENSRNNCLDGLQLGAGEMISTLTGKFFSSLSRPTPPPGRDAIHDRQSDSPFAAPERLPPDQDQTVPRK